MDIAGSGGPVGVAEIERAGRADVPADDVGAGRADVAIDAAGVAKVPVETAGRADVAIDAAGVANSPAEEAAGRAGGAWKATQPGERSRLTASLTPERPNCNAAFCSKFCGTEAAGLGAGGPTDTDGASDGERRADAEDVGRAPDLKRLLKPFPAENCEAADTVPLLTVRAEAAGDGCGCLAGLGSATVAAETAGVIPSGLLRSRE